MQLAAEEDRNHGQRGKGEKKSQQLQGAAREEQQRILGS